MDGVSNHQTILLQLDYVTEKVLGSFKFNHAWIKENDFHRLVLDNWHHYDPNLDEATMVQFVASLKHCVVTWGRERKKSN